MEKLRENNTSLGGGGLDPEEMTALVDGACAKLCVLAVKAEPTLEMAELQALEKTIKWPVELLLPALDLGKGDGKRKDQKEGLLISGSAVFFGLVTSQCVACICVCSSPTSALFFGLRVCFCSSTRCCYLVRCDISPRDTRRCSCSSGDIGNILRWGVTWRVATWMSLSLQPFRHRYWDPNGRVVSEGPRKPHIKGLETTRSHKIEKGCRC